MRPWVNTQHPKGRSKIILNSAIKDKGFPVSPLPSFRKCANPQLTYQVSDPIEHVIRERQGKYKLSCVDQCWPQIQGLHKFQVSLKVPREEQG
jgi:hypothetical protein